MLQNVAIFHPGWACGFAGAAAETSIQVVDYAHIQCKLAFLHRSHKINAPAGRICFISGEAEGRAGIQTEAAADAFESFVVLSGSRFRHLSSKPSDESARTKQARWIKRLFDA